MIVKLRVYLNIGLNKIMKRKKRELKKKLDNFLKDESGNASKDKVLKIGLGTISALGIMASFASNIDAQTHTNNPHANNVVPPPGGGSNTGQAACVYSHSNIAHNNHTNY